VLLPGGRGMGCGSSRRNADLAHDPSGERNACCIAPGAPRAVPLGPRGAWCVHVCARLRARLRACVRARARSPAPLSLGLSSALDEDSEEYDDDEEEAAAAASDQVGVPEWLERLWKTKTELVDQGSVQNLTQATFCKHFGLQTRDCFRALAAFQRCSDKAGRLRSDKFCRMLEWPVDRNRVVNRIVACFDGDADQSMDFREVRYPPPCACACTRGCVDWPSTPQARVRA
jgi:hypothetical protein